MTKPDPLRPLSAPEPGGAAPWAATIRGMLMFLDDYSEGAHPAVLEALVAHNGGQELGYGEDRYSRLAAARIAALAGA